MSYTYVAITVLLTVYGQLIIKWQVTLAGSLPTSTEDKLKFLVQLLLNPWIISAYAAALLASVAWMAAMTRLQLSHAYPFMSLAFILIMVMSSLFFQEPLTMPKMIGLAFVIAGLVIGSNG